MQPYVPPLQYTQGQPEPIAAHGGLSYMSFDQDGDAGAGSVLEGIADRIADHGRFVRVRALRVAFDAAALDEITHLEGAKGKSPLALGIRQDSIELRVKMTPKEIDGMELIYRRAFKY